jgi:trigger factor
VKSTVETLSPTRVRLAIEVPFSELEPSLKKAYRDIGAQVTIPGFRKGKVPAAVIDQRVGRETILTEAVQDTIPVQLRAAVMEHAVRMLGRPEVDITEFADGQPLKFTAEVDVRPEIRLPDPAGVEVTVDPVVVSDEDVDAQVTGLQQRFATLKTVDRPAERGDFVQIDLAATVDGAEVPGGTATNLSVEVGSGDLLPGLDDALVGMRGGEAATFSSALVAGDFAGRDAEVSVTVRTVKEREMPSVDDDFAQLASEFDTIDELRADLTSRIERVKKMEQLYSARDKTLETLIEVADIPAPEGVVRDQVKTQREAVVDQLERMGASLEDYLSSAGRSEEEFEADLVKEAESRVRTQLLLDAYADENEISVTEDEYMHEVVHRAERAGMSPQQYYEQMVRAGIEAGVFADIRRGKALSALLEAVIIKDTDGAVVSVAELRDAGADEAAHDHGHDDHDHEGHDHDHEGHDHDHEGHDHDHEGHDHEGHDHEGHDHEGHDHD